MYYCIVNIYYIYILARANRDHSIDLRPTNVTVGLGFNRFFIHVVNTQRSTPWIANTYILYITRLDKGQQRIFDPGGPHEMCEKLQVRVAESLYFGQIVVSDAMAS